MENHKPTYAEVVAACKAECYEPYDAERLSISAEGRKVEYEGEVWYEMTVADSTSYTCWASILDGQFTTYDRDHLDMDDRIPELDALLDEDED